MHEQFFWPTFGVVFLLALATLAMVANHLRESRKLRLRAIQKEERIKAMEAGTPLPEVDEPANGLSNAAASEAGLVRQIRWLRLVSMALGWFMVFAGLGICIAFYLMPEEDLRGMAPIGLIPALAGIGLLLFYWMTRDYERGPDAA